MDRLGAIKPNNSASTDDSGGSPVLQEIMEEYAPVKVGLKRIKLNVGNLRSLMAADKKCASPEKQGANAAKMNKLMDETTKISQNIKKVLNNIKAADEEFKTTTEAKKSRSQVEMRTNLYNSNAREFYDMMNEYSNCCKDARGDLKSRTRRRLHIVSNKQLDDKQIEDLLDDPEKADQVIKQAIIGDNINQLMSDLTTRQDQMRDLERTMKEVFDLFKDLSVLIDIQGEHIEVISTHVSNANQAVLEGNVELKKAEDYSKAGRKWKCYLIGLLFLILAITVGLLYGTGAFTSSG